MDRDADRLRVLVICHYLLAGLTALCSFPFLIVPLVLASLGTSLGAGPHQDLPADLVAQLVRYVMWSAFLMTWVHAGVIAYIGRCLARRKRYLLCLIFSGLNATMVPLGTILGVFTIVILARPSVKALFTAPGTGG
jgi:hypothetical protein